MELNDLLTYAIGILLAVVGFILKQLWADIRESKDTQGKLKGKIELVEQKFDHGLDNLQHVNNLKFLQLGEKLDIMCNDIKDDIHKLTRCLENMNKEDDRDELGRYKKRN